MKKIKITDLPISEDVKKAISEIGFENATYIQSQSIPLILEGMDIVGHSQTGTGKTAAFGIPILEKISQEFKGSTQALVLCPTRELALQACEEIRKFAKYKHGIRVVPIYGGEPIDRQIKALRGGVEIVIGTPGRVMDHLNRRTLKLNNLQMIVLDEADEMLNMGFREDIETILKYIPSQRQTILFSATMPQAIMDITKEYLTNPKIVKMIHNDSTVPNIKQYYYEIPKGRKVEALARLLEFYNPKRSIVFCNTKKMVDELVDELQELGYSPAGLHGDMKQSVRTSVMNSFKKNSTNILIATDVAARGIDVDDIEAVFNFDITKDPEYYIHRIGRTGRAGKEGTSHTFIRGRSQFAVLNDIIRHTKSEIIQMHLPSMKAIESKRNDKIINKMVDALELNESSEFDFVMDKLIAKGFDIEAIAKSAINIIAKDSASSSITFDDENLVEKKEKRSKKAFEKVKRNPNEPMSRLIINVGKRDNIRSNNIVGAVAGESGIPGGMIGEISIYGNYTFFEVPQNMAKLVVKAMKDCKINGRITKTEPVKNVKKRR